MAKQKQSVFPPEPRGSVYIESPNGVSRVDGNRVTISSYEPGTRADKLPYRDTVTGRYRDRE